MTLKKALRTTYAASAVALFPLGAMATTLTAIEVGGTQDAAITLSNGQQNGVATTFTLTKDLYDASFDFDILCVSSACNGRFFVLNEDVTDGTASVLSTIDASSYSVGSSFSGTGVTAFSGLDLVAGTYSVMMTEILGNAAWLGSTAPSFSVNGGIDGDSGTYIAPSDLLPTFTSFTPFSAPVLQYTLSGNDGGTPNPVPLPATGLLLIGALGLMTIRRQ